MGNITARNLPLYRSLYRKESDAKVARKSSESEPKVAKTSDEGSDDVFEEEPKKECWPCRKGQDRPQTDHRIDLILSLLYCTTIVGGVLVVVLVPLVQMFKSPRKWCREPLRTQDSSAEYCWLDLVQRTFPLTLTDVITFCAGLASFILGSLWFFCKTWRGRRHLWMASFLLLVVFLTEVITSIVIAIIYSQRREYLPIELRKSIKQELYRSVREYASDADIENTWDIVQRSWCCCGVMEPVDWRNYGEINRIPRSCAVLQRKGDRFSCFGYPWKLPIVADRPKYYEEEGFHTPSRGCFELFARKVGTDYVAAINVGWKVLLALSFLQVFGIIAPVVQSCWGSPGDSTRDVIGSCATEMTLAPCPSVDSSLYLNNKMGRQMSRQMSRQTSRLPGPPSVSFSVPGPPSVSFSVPGPPSVSFNVQRQDSQQVPTAPSQNEETGQGLQVC